MYNPAIPPNRQGSQTTTNFNPQPSSQRGSHINSSQNIRGAISSSGTSYSATSTYGGPGLPPSRVSPQVNPTPVFSGSNALAPRGGLGNSGQNIPVGQGSRGASMPSSSNYGRTSLSPNSEPYIPVGCAHPGGAVSSSSLQPSPGSVPSPYAPHSGSHPMSSSNQRGALSPSPLQPSPGSVTSPYAPHSGSHPMSSSHQRGTVPQSSLQPSYGSAFSPYGEPHSTDPYNDRFKNSTGGYS